VAEAGEHQLDPVDYMLAVMRDETAPQDRRDRMATAVAPYTNPRLAVIDARVKTEVVQPLSNEQRRERARQAILEAFAERPVVIEGTVIAGRRSVPRVIAPPDEAAPPDEDRSAPIGEAS